MLCAEIIGLSRKYCVLSISTWTHQSQSYITACGLPPISSSRPQPLWDPRPVFFKLNTCSYNHYVSYCPTRRWVRCLQLLLGLASAVVIGSESRGTQDHILLSQIRDSPNLEGQIPVFISLGNRVAQLCFQALGSLLVASYDSQSYDGGIWTRLHVGLVYTFPLALALAPRRKSHRKDSFQQFFYCCVLIRCCGQVSITPLPSNDLFFRYFGFQT
jgi:hypothetical protein